MSLNSAIGSAATAPKVWYALLSFVARLDQERRGVNLHVVAGALGFVESHRAPRNIEQSTVRTISMLVTCTTTDFPMRDAVEDRGRRTCAVHLQECWAGNRLRLGIGGVCCPGMRRRIKNSPCDRIDVIREDYAPVRYRQVGD